MLVIKIELHSARTGGVKEIGTGIILNDGSGSMKLGNYKGSFANIPDSDPTRYEIKGDVEVRDFKRFDKDAWDLLYEALKELHREEET